MFRVVTKQEQIRTEEAPATPPEEVIRHHCRRIYKHYKKIVPTAESRAYLRAAKGLRPYKPKPLDLRTEKACCKCKVVKPNTPEYFKHSSYKGNRRTHSLCKECSNAIQRSREWERRM